jgi:hypothetical protein
LLKALLGDNDMTTIIAANQSVGRGVYGMAIRTALAIPEDFIASHAERINRAYDMGEPIAMICDELLFRFQHRPQPTKSPRELAVRVVKL